MATSADVAMVAIRRPTGIFSAAGDGDGAGAAEAGVMADGTAPSGSAGVGWSAVGISVAAAAADGAAADGAAADGAVAAAEHVTRVLRILDDGLCARLEAHEEGYLLRRFNHRAEHIAQIEAALG